MILPVAILLITMGILGFIYTQHGLFIQWGNSAVLELERAAHQVDMRLSRPKEWLQVFNTAFSDPKMKTIHEVVLQQLQMIEGVDQVKLTLNSEGENVGSTNFVFPRVPKGQSSYAPDTLHEMEKLDSARLAPPRYDASENHETVSLISDLINRQTNAVIGHLEVVLRFDYLIAEIVQAGWWQHYKAFLLDESGHVLTGTQPEMGSKRIFGDLKLEAETLRAVREKSSGTIIGEGIPPDEVSGFCKLRQAPWTLVVIAPGREVLSPLMRFQFYYLLIGAVFIFVILLLIKGVTRSTAAGIKSVSSAARKVARGDYSTRLPVASEDEVGELMGTFNVMVVQIEEGIRLKKALDVAMEVQQALLPKKPLAVFNYDIAGRTVYCDETGGDYFDFFQFEELGPDRVGIAVGDVVGHGIDAALLMTTARAFLRSRIVQPGSFSEMMGDINRLLHLDTEPSGGFMTLFLAVLDHRRREITWVRAGHDAAILYDPIDDSFKELMGEGISLGITPHYPYREYTQSGFSPGRILLIGTDGIWDTKNQKGEMFGKDRLRDIIRKHSDCTSEGIANEVIRQLDTFRMGAAQKDDVTLVVVKSLKEDNDPIR